MTGIFDTQSGILHINDAFFLNKDMSPEDIKSHGMQFVREINQSPELIIKVFNIFFIGKERWISLYFNNNKLIEVHFSFWDPDLDKPYEYESSFERQNIFLKNELGQPDKENKYSITYKFLWGDISSAVDLKNMSSSIVMTWN